MGFTEVSTPVASANWKDRKFGNNDGSSDCGSNFLGGLDAQTNMTLSVTNNNNSLESCPLTCTGLLLDRLDLYFVTRW